MSYDLHNGWDSDNPFGSPILSHTNLSEINYALDERIGVEPSSIVLSLCFYDRSFELEARHGATPIQKRNRISYTLCLIRHPYLLFEALKSLQQPPDQLHILSNAYYIM
ncbi:hypothetical protein EDB81DRAFT_891876 [Dactylonectria macrodidyma]|uniref:Uncharacterized protein n=1 Tax=Dactylonectria macrodidyma TaxID=307937 RepID=A0A9P9DGK4_9HYPO|nr:hypothetical protein EDB81DRAFT_891876 [Dactylonectria macrodidyma]